MKRKVKDNIITYTSSPRLEIIGNSECIVDGLKGISEYNSDKIRINLGKYFITFFGDDLRIDSFSYKGAVVQGNIVSMEFDTYG